MKNNPPDRSAHSLAAEIAADPAASYWLKEAVVAALKRDPLDALRDAQELVRVLAIREAEVLGSQQSGSVGSVLSNN